MFAAPCGGLVQPAGKTRCPELLGFASTKDTPECETKQGSGLGSRSLESRGRENFGRTSWFERVYGQSGGRTTGVRLASAGTVRRTLMPPPLVDVLPNTRVPRRSRHGHDASRGEVVGRFHRRGHPPGLGAPFRVIACAVGWTWQEVWPPNVQAGFWASWADALHMIEQRLPQVAEHTVISFVS